MASAVGMALLLVLSALALAPVARGLRAAPLAVPKVGTGKIFFLMMAIDRIEQEEIWARFLAGGELGVSYEAFLHCTDHQACLKNVARLDLFTLVPTVPSSYCSDLVSPMLALLNAAIRHAAAGNPYDKFAMVSSNSLPVKPFWKLHRVLTEGQEGMATFQTGSKKCGFFKASQWFFLSYWHADRMLQAANRSAPRLIHSCWPRCLDENWPLVAIFGEDELRKYPAWPKSLQAKDYWFIDWDHTQQDLHVQMVRGPLGPATYTSVSAEFLSSFRAADKDEFVLARKFSPETRFAGNLSLADAFDAYVFGGAAGPPPEGAAAPSRTSGEERRG